MKKLVPVPIIFLLFLFSPIAFAHYEHFKIPTATITIDGNSDDWNDIEPAYIDDVNDQDKNADYDGTDLYKCYLAKDDTFLYLMMTLYDGAPKEEDSTTGMVTLYHVGFGDSVGDRVAFANQSRGTWHSSISEIEETSPWTQIADYSSSYVGVGSNFIEWKVYLSDIGKLNGKFITMWIHPFVEGEVEKYSVSDYASTYIHIVDEDTITTTPTPTATKTLTPTPTPTPKASPTPAGTGIIYGVVTDVDGFPFKNVSVLMTGANDYSKSTKTDKEGYYEFTNLEAGDYTVTYEKDGYQTTTQEVSLEEGETVDLGTIILEQIEKGSVSGYVVDITGNPIESVRLKLKGIRTKTTKIESTDADGFFEFTDLEADDYMITATKRRYRSARKSITIEEGEATEVEIEMRKTSKRRALTSKQQTQDCRL